MADRERMLHDILMEVDYTQHLTGRASFSTAIMEAMAKVPRHEFVPAGEESFAYNNGPLRIGCGQTISQPFIVALMTDLLEPEPEHRFLEIGTGSGYQTAILAQLVSMVYSIEIIQQLSSRAELLLRHQGYENIECRVGDGYYGWPEHAPFDGIIVTAAAPFVPQALVDQLIPGGRMVIPIGSQYGHQELILFEKNDAGKLISSNVLAVAFVPLTGEH